MNLNFKNRSQEERIKFIVEFSCLFNKLRPKEKEVLNRLLFYQSISSYPVLTSYETKIKIRDDVNISEHNLNNILLAFRKKNIVKNNRLTEVYENLITTQKININL